MFNAGAGNCHGGGHPRELFGTFSRQLAVLADETLVYPGHDYITNNLSFTLDREPDNQKARQLHDEVVSQDPNTGACDNPRSRKRGQYLLQTAESDRDRTATRGLFRSSG